jgi:phosphoserine phosphatase RsbU/P
VTPFIQAPRRLTLREALQRTGWWERLFACFLLLVLIPAGAALLDGSLSGGRGVFFSLALIGLLVTAPVAIWRIGRLLLRSIIWRLRNRLIVAYIFIALVPLLLLTTLAGLVSYIVTGQMAIYLVTAELERQTGTLRGAAESVLRVPAARRLASVERIGGFFEERFPNFEIRVDQDDVYVYPEDASIEKPPADWKDASGIVKRGEEYYIWAHVHAADGEVTAMAPLSADYLSQLIPKLGPVSILGSVVDDPAKGVKIRRSRRKTALKTPPASVPVPEPVNRLDVQLNWPTLLPVAVWDQPGKPSNELLSIQTRVFAVLKIIFSRSAEWDQNIGFVPLLSICALFLIFETIALIIGVTLTRTITNTVHDIYEGTNKVMEGDFAHRIPVPGKDQLAQLAESFNRMTENLELLLQVAKENERLNAELEIAREVQRQLYPKSVPASTRIHLTAHYQPARMVSGDYFDFHRLSHHQIGFSMGDVAGKGISAALLMATVQSSFRSQIQARDWDSLAASASTDALVAELNKQLYATTAPEKFSTFFFAIFDESTGVMRYTNAGHLPPILIRNGEASLLQVDGMVVGAFPFATFGQSSIQLEPNDLLLLYTDGISEPQNDYGEMFGEDRLIDVVKRHAHLDDAGIIQAVMNAVIQWTGSPELQDDMTMLIARHKSPTAA